MLKRIRIISTPPGDAALVIRQCWIGCEFPAEGPRTPQPGMVQGSVVTSEIRHNPPASYDVKPKDAFAALAIREPEAYQWWKDHAPRAFSVPYLTFDASCCEEIGESEGTETEGFAYWDNASDYELQAAWDRYEEEDLRASGPSWG